MMGTSPSTSTLQAPSTRLGPTEPISLANPTPEDLSNTHLLNACLRETGFFESEEEAKQRESVLARLNVVIREFVREVARRKGLPVELAKSTNGKIFTFGSYRLGVHSRGADIDTLCVAPQHVTREDFFTVLPELISTRLTTNKIALVQDAYVPVMNIEAEGICLDLVFARIPGETSIQDSFDLLSNRMLTSLDEKCVLSVNGSRTTDEILRLVPNVEAFHAALRSVKLWAKRRGLYGNSYGYLNGVACAILTARICQLYPNAAPSTIVLRFFHVYSTWPWPNPVYLKVIEDPSSHLYGHYHLRVWNPRLNPADKHHRMPIITPAYPSMCSTHNVSDSTMRIMLTEMNRGFDICKKVVSASADWNDLFTKSDFFIRHRHFFQVIAITKGEVEHRAWSGYVESRFRHLTMNLEREQDIDMAPPFPEAFEFMHESNKETDLEGCLGRHYRVYPMDSAKTLDNAEGQSNEFRIYSTAFYVGLVVKNDPLQPRAPRKLILDRPINDFKTYILGWEKFQPANMFLFVRDIRRDNLPDYVFEGGGPARPPPRPLARSGSVGSLAGASAGKKRSSEALLK